MWRASARAHTLNERADDLFSAVLHGRVGAADIAEYERSARALQAELTLGSPYPDAAYPDLDARYASALAALRDAWRDEQHASTDHLYPSTDNAASEAWYESETDIPY